MVFEYPGPNEAVDEVIRTTGAILAGRRTYEVGAREDQVEPASKPYGGAWTGPVFVLTHEPSDAPEDPLITFLSGGLAGAVATARTAAGEKNVVIFGANVAQQCLDAGLLDEVLVHVAPVLLGDGVRLFARKGGKPVKLEKTVAADSGQLTDLRFRVIGV